MGKAGHSPASIACGMHCPRSGSPRLQAFDTPLHGQPRMGLSVVNFPCAFGITLSPSLITGIAGKRLTIFKDFREY